MDRGRHTRGFLVVLMLLFPVLGFAEDTEDVVVINVAPKSLNCYGHWAGSEIEVRLAGDRVFADGWRVYPVLPVKEEESEMPKRCTPPTSLRGLLVAEALTLRDSLFSEGKEAAEVVDACKKMLEESGLVKEVEQVGGPNYTIHFKNPEWITTGVVLGPCRFWEEEWEGKRQRLSRRSARATFEMIVDTLERGGLVIIATHVAMQTT